MTFKMIRFLSGLSGFDQKTFFALMAAMWIGEEFQIISADQNGNFFLIQLRVATVFYVKGLDLKSFRSEIKNFESEHI